MRNFSDKATGSTEENILLLARNAITVIERNQSTLDDLLDTPEYRPLRRTLSHLLMEYFKRKKVIDSTLETFFRKIPAPETFSLLKAALTQAVTQERMAPQAVVNVAVEVAKKERNQGFVNAVLRRALESFKKKKLSSAPADVLPDKLLNRWKKEFSQPVIEQLTDAFSSTADFTFRIEKQQFPESFEYQKAYTICSKFPFGSAKPSDVLNSQEFQSGKLYIQDPAASLAVSIAPDKDFDNILDLCAAPGGKSLMLLEKYPNVRKFTAFDRSEKRQQLTKKNFELRNISHKVSSDRKDLEGTWNLILIDAPCSNTGVFRRRPDALWRFSESELEKTAAIQKELLDFAASRLAADGYIIYSTCSIENLEDEQQIEMFLSRHSDFICENMKKLLPRREHDGAFCALLKKAGGM